MRFAEAGIAELHKVVDTLLIIPNQNLFRVANEKTTFADAFAMADQVLYSGVACITDLMVKEGLINLDFADVRAVMREMGKAMMGTGEASGEKRALTAAEAAIANPLIDDASMKGARGLLISITGGNDLTLLRGRRSRHPHPRGSRSGRQHHCRRHLRREPRRHHPRLRGCDRHRDQSHGAHARRRWRRRPCGRSCQPENRLAVSLRACVPTMPARRTRHRSSQPAPAPAPQRTTAMSSAPRLPRLPRPFAEAAAPGPDRLWRRHDAPDRAEAVAVPIRGDARGARRATVPETFIPPAAERPTGRTPRMPNSRNCRCRRRTNSQATRRDGGRRASGETPPVAVAAPRQCRSRPPRRGKRAAVAARASGCRRCLRCRSASPEARWPSKSRRMSRYRICSSPGAAGVGPPRPSCARCIIATGRRPARYSGLPAPAGQLNFVTILAVGKGPGGQPPGPDFSRSGLSHA